MTTYRYRAAAADGTTISGSERRSAPHLVRQALLARDLEPLTIERRKSILELEITTKTVDKRLLMHLCRQLAVFIRSGVSVLEALSILAEENSDKLTRTALDDMRSLLEGGARFADASAAHPELFPAYAAEVLRSAELTGNLDQVLDQLGDYLEREVDTKQKVRSAMAYPAVVLGLAVAVSIVLVVYVLPKFRTFFTSLHAKLPLPTRVLLAVADFIGRNGIYIASAMLVLLVAAVTAMRFEPGRAARDEVLLRIPVVGKLMHTAITERFCRLLSSMVVAGVALPEAIAVTTGATSNVVFRRQLTAARSAMMRGEGIAGPLAATGLFPGAVRQMLRVGEDTGTLDDQLRAAAGYLDRELDYKLKRFTTMIEPAVILAVGLVVGFVAIALVSAMYGIFNQVKV